MPTKTAARRAKASGSADRKPVAVECGYTDCSNTFEPKRSTAKFCSATCRQRARRAAKAAEAETATTTGPDTGDAEHGLVRAVRKELTDADALDTVAGQLALQLARRAADPTESGLSALSKEIRVLVAEARGKAAPAGAATDGEPAAPEEPDDEVTRARKAREDARQAAGRA